MPSLPNTENLQSYNASAWGHQSILKFFDVNRKHTDHIYPSEWFFLQKKLKKGISILDIGCAKGGFANAFAEYFAQADQSAAKAKLTPDSIGSSTPFHYTGVDINSDMIASARKEYPQHTFHVIDNDDYHILKNEHFDLVLCLGILHLHENWRRTLELAFQHTKTDLIFDLRETYLPSIEDKNKSFFKMDFDNVANPKTNVTLPYNIINTSDALQTIQRICKDAKKISHFGYTQKVSALCVSPIKELMTNVYCVER